MIVRYIFAMPVPRWKRPQISPYNLLLAVVLMIQYSVENRRGSDKDKAKRMNVQTKVAYQTLVL